MRQYKWKFKLLNWGAVLCLICSFGMKYYRSNALGIEMGETLLHADAVNYALLFSALCLPLAYFIDVKPGLFGLEWPLHYAVAKRQTKNSVLKAPKS
jgi:hypothetical protein